MNDVNRMPILNTEGSSYGELIAIFGKEGNVVEITHEDSSDKIDLIHTGILSEPDVLEMGVPAIEALVDFLLNVLNTTNETDNCYWCGHGTSRTWPMGSDDIPLHTTCRHEMIEKGALS